MQHGSHPRPEQKVLQRLVREWKSQCFLAPDPSVLTATEQERILETMRSHAETLRERLHEALGNSIGIIKSQMVSLLVALQEVLFQKQHYDSGGSFELDRPDLENLVIFLEIVRSRTNIGIPEGTEEVEEPGTLSEDVLNSLDALDPDIRHVVEDAFRTKDEKLSEMRERNRRLELSKRFAMKK